jgi:hypothetical protein
VAKSKNWPTTAEALGRGLRRPATFLRNVGIEVSFERDKSKRTRRIRIIRNEVEPDNRMGKPSEPSEPSDTRQTGNKINASASNGSALPSELLAHGISTASGRGLNHPTRKVRQTVEANHSPPSRHRNKIRRWGRST